MLNIRKYTHIKTTSEYEVLLKRIYPQPKIETPFGSAFVNVEAGKKSKPHQHHEHETFIILKGSGTFVQDGEQTEIKEGDVVYIEPFSEHYVQAQSDKEVQFLSVWWNEKQKTIKSSNEKHIIFTPPPTPNGELHLGHMAGPYISADIVKRHLTSKGKSVSMIVGTDRNQSYVDLKARQIGVSSEKIYSNYSDSIFKTFDNASIHYDDSYDCKSQFHLKFVEHFVQLMLDKKLICIEQHESLICENCQHELYDAFALGKCPHCQSRSNGCICEDCGKPNNSYDLHDVVCNLCGGIPKKRLTVKGSLDMVKCRESLSHTTFEINAPDQLAKYLELQKQPGLEKYIISFDSSWGLQSNLPELNGQVYLVWLEMAAGYLAAIYKNLFQEEVTDVEHVIHRLNDADYHIIHFMGFDNSFYYACLYPQIFAALGLRKLKVTYVVNNFLLLDQSKFSTSRNHAIWANDVFTTPEVTDWYRFYLSLKKPESSRENFDSDEFDRFRQDNLNRISHVLDTHHSRLDTYFSGIVPESGAWVSLHRDYADFFNSCENHLQQCLSEPNGYSVKQYAEGVKHLLDILCRFQQKTVQHYLAGFDADTRRTSMYLESSTVGVLSHHLACLMPNFILHCQKTR